MVVQTPSGQRERLSALVQQLHHAPSDEARCVLLEEDPLVMQWGRAHELTEFEVEERVLLLALVAMGQSALLDEALRDDPTRCRHLLGRLQRIERFYYPLGGLLGYQEQVIRIIEARSPTDVKYHRPQGIDITQPTVAVRHAVLAGIEALPTFAEIYTVGGAGDRLGLMDADNTPLAAACLRLLGSSLLGRLVRDLQGREYLYYKLTGRQIETPILLMTSEEAQNHNQIMALCEERGWFGRAPGSFHFVTQPMVPMVTQEGRWVTKSPGELWLKPGGHGVLWHLAMTHGAVDWLRNLGRRRVLVRQINNPLAGYDDGMLAFCGMGVLHGKKWGFASCPRLVGASEGMVVLREQNHELALTNVEYTDFVRHGIEDVPASGDSSHSVFPSNTNLLFADLEAVAEADEKISFPGLLINWKHKHKGDQLVGRLEATMQNLADAFSIPVGSDLNELPSYLTYGLRHKTISAIKRTYRPGHLAETPQQAFYDLLRNHYEILQQHCGFELPPLLGLDPDDPRGPTCTFLPHPSLGPLFEIIGQKIRGGRMAPFSELILDITNCDISNLDLNGRLHIEAHALMGHYEQGRLHYSEQTGRCRLRDVTVRTTGWQPAPLGDRWTRRAPRDGLLHIILHGDAEIDAENVMLSGPATIEVPAHHRLVLRPNSRTLVPIDAPSWEWHYAVSDEARIILTCVEP